MVTELLAALDAERGLHLAHRRRRHDRARRSREGGSDLQLVLAAILGIAVVVLLITWLKVHPFLALILGSLLLGIVAGLAFSDTITSFQTGVGATVGSVGVLIALGAMIGGLLAESGGADRVVTAFVDRVSARRLPWAMAGVAALIGIPLFFEVGVVLLDPDRAARRPAHATCRCWPSASRPSPACRCCTDSCRRTPDRWSPSTRWTPTWAGPCCSG